MLDEHRPGTPLLVTAVSVGLLLATLATGCSKPASPATPAPVTVATTTPPAIAATSAPATSQVTQPATVTPPPAPQPTPKPEPKPKPMSSKSGAIVVVKPTSGSAVSSPVRVSGTADVFEAQFRVQILDAHGTVIADEPVRATAGSGTRGTFAIDVAYPSGHAGHGTVMAFDISEKDGSKTDVVKVPVTLR